MLDVAESVVVSERGPLRASVVVTVRRICSSVFCLFLFCVSLEMIVFHYSYLIEICTLATKNILSFMPRSLSKASHFVAIDVDGDVEHRGGRCGGGIGVCVRRRLARKATIPQS